MAVASLNPIFSYSNSFLPQEAINQLTSKAMQVFQEQSKHFAIIGSALSAIGAAYTAISNNTNQWVFYAAGSLISLGIAYYQGHLERTLALAYQEIQKIKSSLLVAETALSDRDLLLTDLSKTKESLQATSELLMQAGVNEQKLFDELAATKEKQKELSDIVVKLTTIVSFFENLKGTYPDQELFLAHLNSIEKITRTTQKHLATTDSETGEKLQELKIFLETLSKQDIDQIALLSEINKGVTSIQKGVDTANQSLEELKSGTA